MSFDQLPTELMQEIATFSLADEMKSVNKELRQASLSQRVIDRRRNHMDSLGKKGSADDVMYYMSNSKGFQSYLNSFIPWDDLTMAKYEEDEYITQLSRVWQHAVENDMQEALDILLLKDIPIDLQKKIFARIHRKTMLNC